MSETWVPVRSAGTAPTRAPAAAAAAPPRTRLAPTARACRGTQEVWERAARLLGRVAHLGAAGAAVRAAGGIPALLRLLQHPGQAAPDASAGAGAGAPERVALAVAEAVTVLCAGQEVNQDAVRRGALPWIVRGVRVCRVLGQGRVGRVRSQLI